MRALQRTGIFFFMLLSTLTVRAQIQVHSSLDNREYTIGDYIRLQLRVTADSTLHLQWPEAQDITDYTLISAGPTDTIHDPQHFGYAQEIVYSIYDSGMYYFPSVSIAYTRPRDTTVYYATSDSIAFIVHTVAVDTTQAIMPIKAPIEVQVRNMLWMYILGGIILLGIIGFSIYYFFFRKKEKVIKPVVVTPLSLYEITLQKLDTLEKEKLWQNDQLKKYYSELTDILRMWMEGRFQIQALESTSDEIMEQMQRVFPAQEQLEHLHFILETADLAKFAKSRPLPQDNTRAMEWAVAFVQQSKPAAEEKEVQA